MDQKPKLGAKGKSVLSGDTFTLQSLQPPFRERSLSLAYVSAPRLRQGSEEEPFAYAAREYLRTKLVGKQITFSVLYSFNDREYGDVFAGNQSLVSACLKAGIVKLRNSNNQQIDEQRLAELKSLETAAKDAKIGLWGASGSELVEVVDQIKPGKYSEAIVEHVFSASLFKLRIVLSKEKHALISASLAGVRANKVEEEFGAEAKSFVESRLLQRTLEANIFQIQNRDGGNSYIVILNHPAAGSIAEALLKTGTARCAGPEHSLAIGETEMKRLRNAENEAKKNKLKIFKNIKDEVNYDAHVVQILNGDSLEIRQRGEVKRVSLSSIKQPRSTNNVDDKQSVYQAQAKEYLRKRLVGRNVHVIQDYIRPANEGFKEQEAVTITVSKSNVALELVERGLATVIRHKRDDDRSPIYDELLAAEQKAQEEKKGLNNPKGPGPQRIVDASESGAKAKQFLSQLQRSGRIQGVVDFVISPNRLRIVIPGQSLKLLFVVSGIRTPRVGRGSEKSEPFAEESLEYVRKKALQRDVEIEVKDVDKTGGFLGTLTINGEELARGLLKAGLAYVPPEQSRYVSPALVSIAKEAENGRVGLWHDYDEQQANKGTQNGTSSASTTRRTEKIKIVITDATPEGDFYVQIIDKNISQLEKLMTELQNLGLSSKPQTVKKGELVAAKSAEDGQWYRARISARPDGKAADVHFVDYGNSETVPLDSVRELSSTQKELSPQAHSAVLSFIKWPPADYMNDALNLFYSLVSSKELSANIDSKGDGISLTIYDLTTGKEDLRSSINAILVKEGLAKVKPQLFRTAWEKTVDLSALEGLETEARKSRSGMFQYGDPYDDDE